MSSKAKAEAVVYGLDKLGELLGGTKAERLARAADKGVDYARMGERTGGNVPGAGILDTSLAARMRRAEEQWYNPSQRWYHGTAETDEYGDPITSFISSSDKFDTNFMSDMGSWFTDSPDVANHFADKNFSGAQPQVYPVYLRQKNPARFDTYEDLEDAFAEFDGSAPEFAQHLKAQGHDGIIVENSDTDISLLRRDAVMFDSRDARSVNANFDPAKADSSDLLAGIANVAAPLLKTAVGTGAAYTAAGALAPQEAEAGPIKILSHIDDAGKAVYKTVIDAWHGSPHKFPPTERNPLGEFDISKIGTGEGAQAYGHGLYLADAKDVGNQYRINLGYNPDEMKIAGTQINDYYTTLSDQAAALPMEQARPLYDRMELVERLMQNESVSDVAKYADELGQGEWFGKEVAPSYETFGGLYRAHIDVDPDTLLDWDKPLSEQSPVVRERLSALAPQTPDYNAMSDEELRTLLEKNDRNGEYRVDDYGEPITRQDLLDSIEYQRDEDPAGWDAWVSGSGFLPDQPGSGILHQLEASHGSVAEASQRLNALGIPGIRYLDGVSRNAGEGSYNYVMFDDKPINIVERGNANPLLLGGATLATGGAMALGAQEAEAKNPLAILDALRKKFPVDGAKLAENYPDIGTPVLQVDKKTGKQFMSKGLSDEEINLQKQRNSIQKNVINTGEYVPIFDESQRYYADPSLYSIQGNTLTDTLPKKQATHDKWMAKIDTPEVRAKLKAAYDAGKLSPDAHDWYAMGQLQDAFIKELGPEIGPAMFKERFADAMAATTGGADPTANLLMASYGNFNRTAGLPPGAASYKMPHPIGGRYVTGNMGMYDRVINQGEGLSTAGTPKRHNFSANFLGDRGRATIDEQMTNGMLGMNAPPQGTYGIVESLVHDLAKKEGTEAANIQDVSWAGFKGSEGFPMIRHVNEMIARTSAVTGKPQEEVLKGFIRGNMPMYGIAGATVAGGLLAPNQEAYADTGTAAVTGAGMAAYSSDSPNYEMPAYDGIDLSGSNLMQDPQYIDQINAYVRDAFEAQTAADQFTQIRSSKQGYWEARRQDLLDMVDSLGELAVESSPTLVGAMGMIGMNKDRLMTDADMPLRSLLAGGGAIIDAAQGQNLQTIGNNAQQIIQSPSEDTTYGVGGTITDALSPYIPDEAAAAAGALVHGGLQIGTL